MNDIAPFPESTAYRSPNLPIPRQRVRSIDYKCRALGGELVEQWEGTGRNYEIDLDPTLDESGDEFNVGAKRTEWAVEVNENYAHQRSLVRSMWIVANDEAPPTWLIVSRCRSEFCNDLSMRQTVHKLERLLGGTGRVRCPPETHFEASAELVRRLLAQNGYSLQAPSKQAEGTSHPDRDGQFNYLSGLVSEFMSTDDPVIFVDTKKKETPGHKSNGGTEYQPKGEPTRTDVHDFPDPALGRAIPYGVYDVTNNEGWVSVGDTADTSEFAIAAIAKWWDTLGKHKFPYATRLLITADCGGSNGCRVRAWKWHLARLAESTGLEITVAHYPPGTSK